MRSNKGQSAMGLWAAAIEIFITISEAYPTSCCRADLERLVFPQRPPEAVRPLSWVQRRSRNFVGRISAQFDRYIARPATRRATNWVN